MKKSFFILIYFFLHVILLFFTAPELSAVDPIPVDPDVDAYHKEINVKQGENFTIRLNGSGWYLNRYDSKNLSFMLRTVHTLYTDFTVHPSGEEPAYLFFSYLDKDMYIRVNIEPLIGSDDKEELNDSGGISEQKEDIPPEIDAARVESPATADEEANMDSGPAVDKMPVAEDIYYVTKDKEIVKIPNVNEEAEYRKGVKAFNNDELDKAEEHVLEYLSNCAACLYKEDALFMAYEINIKQENEETAVIFLNELIDSADLENKLRAVRLKADINFKTGRLEEALEGYKTLLLHDGTNIEVLKNTGDIYYQFKDYGNAITNYELGMENGLTVDKVYFRTALMYDSAGKLKNIEKAYRYYRLILEMFPDFEHYPEVEHKVQFMEKNFFNYE